MSSQNNFKFELEYVPIKSSSRNKAVNLDNFPSEFLKGCSAGPSKLLAYYLLEDRYTASAFKTDKMMKKKLQQKSVLPAYL